MMEQEMRTGRTYAAWQMPGRKERVERNARADLQRDREVLVYGSQETRFNLSNT